MLAATPLFAQHLDQYQCISEVKGQNVTGFFHEEQFGPTGAKRWLMVCPSGGVIWPFTISNFRSSSYGNDQNAQNWQGYLGLKYASASPLYPSDGFTTATQRWSYFERDVIKLLGFTGTDAFCFNPGCPTWNTDGSKTDIPVGNLPRNDLPYNIGPIEYSQLFLGNNLGHSVYGAIAQPVNASSWPYFPDVFCTCWVNEVTTLTNDGSAWDSDPYVIVVFPEQEDQMRGLEYTHQHLGFMVAATSPYVGFDPHQYGSGSSHATKFSDPEIYSKAQLVTYLQSVYGAGGAGVTALNASWGTSYTSWGTTQVATTSVPVQKFQATSSAPPYPALTGDGATLSFDGFLPPYLPITGGTITVHYTVGASGFTSTDSVSGNGTLAANTQLASGSVNLTTGEVVLTFNGGQAPDNTTQFTVDFTGGGWRYPGTTPGTGFLDENGTDLGSATDWKGVSTISPNGTILTLHPTGAATALTTCGPSHNTNCMLYDLTNFAATMWRQWSQTIYNAIQTYRPNHLGVLSTVNMSEPRDYVWSGTLNGTTPLTGLFNADPTVALNQQNYVNLLNGKIPLTESLLLIDAAADSDLTHGQLPVPKRVAYPGNGWTAVDSFSFNDGTSQATVNCSACNFWWNGTWPGAAIKVMVQFLTPSLSLTFTNPPLSACTNPFPTCVQQYFVNGYSGSTAYIVQAFNASATGSYTQLKNAVNADIAAGKTVYVRSMPDTNGWGNGNGGLIYPVTQEDKGADFRASVLNHYNARASNGDYISGYSGWWDISDDTRNRFAEQHEFGMVDTRDNLKDGIVNGPNAMSDHQGFTSQPEPGSIQYGDFTDSVSETLHSIQASIAQNYANTTLPVTANLAYRKGIVATCTANSVVRQPSYAVDGVYTTQWTSCPSGTQSLYVDLGSATTVGKVTLEEGSSAGSGCTVATSNDSSSWTTQVTSFSQTANTIESKTFTGVSARYVRLQCTTAPMSLNELQVYSQ